MGEECPTRSLGKAMRYFAEALPKKQIKVLKALGPHMASKGFYLAGGTALALHYGHRISIDLDWFTMQPFEDSFLLAQALRNSGLDLQIEQVSQGTLHGSIQGVRVTFLQYQYLMIKPVQHWKEMSCDLASLEDLACMKLSAIAQRGARKDFCDLYALGKTSFSLQQMLGYYQKKFGIRDIGSVLYGLVYFDDAENERMPRMLWNINWRDIKRTILEWVKNIP
jgi:hypothetical protein